jgi:hypothetical protein
MKEHLSRCSALEREYLWGVVFPQHYPEHLRPNDPLDALKDAFLGLGPRDRYLFREWVVKQICGELLH